ncbi:MAG: LPS export ABC transporter periplasmic protein LptC [Candidatus Krumholzibacteria bacterium]|nr:LPS export ABC transporter periplasmic protein LptC [Candidatus Krumholzibacteria bacterium]MDP7021219.1 LPS export ABC transporter periplasmic protein LptC [Candidatus Krumholzibacteria bacterium]
MSLKPVHQRSPLPSLGPVFIVFLGILLSFLACSRRSEESGLDSAKEIPREILWDFEIAERDSGRLQMTLAGEQAWIYDSRPEVRAHGIRLCFYDEQGVAGSVLTADSASQDRRDGKSNGTAYGNVRIVSTEGYVLTSSELHWDHVRREFHTDSFVEVWKGQDYYSGYEIRSDEGLEDVTIAREPFSRIADMEGEFDD